MTTDTANALPALDRATIDYAIRFHGHQCGGLAIGIQAARLALREVGAPAPDEEIVAVVETDMCAVDAIQALTGCTFGKGNLIHRDWGRTPTRSSGARTARRFASPLAPAGTARLSSRR